MEAPITIRPIIKADNAALARIVRAALAEFGANKPGTVYFDPTTDDLYTLFQTPGSFYWVAIDETEQILGGAGLYPTPGLPDGYAELVKMYLAPPARGRGLGGQLIRQVIAGAFDLGYHHLYLETLPELRKAVQVYEQFGFQYLSGPLGDSGHFGCDVWMHKSLY
jgi:putative acetyltransferase